MSIHCPPTHSDRLTEPCIAASNPTMSTDYVPLYPYNNTDPNGGDSLTENLNIYYEVNPEHIGYPFAHVS